MQRIIVLLIFLFIAAPLAAANTAEFIVVIDQSRSMKKNLPAVKDFVEKRIINEIAEDNDTIHLLSFDGKLYGRKVLKGNADIFQVGYALDEIQATGGYTDLTNAVIEMTDYISTKTQKKSKKIIFFLTDGVNEPPSYSPYSETLNHTFFQEATEKRQKGGWKLLILGLGKKTGAPELATILNADYVQLSESPSLHEFDTHITEKLQEARKPDSTVVIITSIAAISALSATALIISKTLQKRSV